MWTYREKEVLMYYDPREQQRRQQEIKIAQSNAAVTPITPTSPLSAPSMQKGMMQETTEDFGKQVFTKILTAVLGGMNVGGPIGKKRMGYNHGGEAQQVNFLTAAQHKMKMKEYEVQKAQERADKAAVAKERRAEEAHAAKLAREAIKESGMVRSKTMPFQEPPAIMTTILGSQTFPSHRETGSPHVYKSQAGLEEQAAREEHAEKVGFPYFVSREGR